MRYEVLRKEIIKERIKNSTSSKYFEIHFQVLKINRKHMRHFKHIFIKKINKTTTNICTVKR